VSDQFRPRLDRRVILRMFAIGAAAASAGANASAQAQKFPDKHKAHYQANSPEVQTFYRVNRYPAKQK
jgi:hypothetical protein